MHRLHCKACSLWQEDARLLLYLGRGGSWAWLRCQGILLPLGCSLDPRMILPWLAPSAKALLLLFARAVKACFTPKCLHSPGGSSASACCNNCIACPLEACTIYTWRQVTTQTDGHPWIKGCACTTFLHPEALQWRRRLPACTTPYTQDCKDREANAYRRM